MIDQENIDKFFKDRFSETEFLPPTSVWENIEAALEKKRANVLLFYRSLIAGLVLLLAVGGTLFFYGPGQIEKTGSNDMGVVPLSSLKQKKTEEGTLPHNNKKDAGKAPKQKQGVAQPARPAHSLKNLAQITKTKEHGSAKPAFPPSGKSPQDEKALLSNCLIPQYKKIDPKKVPSFSGKGKLKLSYFKIAEYESILAGAGDDPQKETLHMKKENWQLGARIVPLFTYRDVAKSENDSYGNSGKDYNSNEKGMLALGAGLNLHYQISDKITIQSGLGYSVMGQTIKDVRMNASAATPVFMDFYQPESKPSRVREENFVNSFGAIEIKDKTVLVSNERSLKPKAFNPDIENKETIVADKEVDLMQRLEYIEVPLLMRYSLHNEENFQFQLLGGLSSNFLVGNNVYMIEEDNYRKNIGKTQTVKKISYSGTVGMVFQFSLLDKLSLNIEPALKYYLTPLNNSSYIETHPYSIGLYTGVTYFFQ